MQEGLGNHQAVKRIFGDVGVRLLSVAFEGSLAEGIVSQRHVEAPRSSSAR